VLTGLLSRRPGDRSLVGLAAAIAQLGELLVVSLTVKDGAE